MGDEIQDVLKHECGFVCDCFFYDMDKLDECTCFLRELLVNKNTNKEHLWVEESPDRAKYLNFGEKLVFCF